mmetsp:Transcript_105235/g.285784  ORF Transcript_105235/g.285784 Transcript_105235/m.285784 type:complete len:276 (-) Transcript_105235:375-1202(-)
MGGGRELLLPDREPQEGDALERLAPQLEGGRVRARPGHEGQEHLHELVVVAREAALEARRQRTKGLHDVHQQRPVRGGVQARHEDLEALLRIRLQDVLLELGNGRLHRRRGHRRHAVHGVAARLQQGRQEAGVPSRVKLLLLVVAHLAERESGGVSHPVVVVLHQLHEPGGHGVQSRRVPRDVLAGSAYRHGRGKLPLPPLGSDAVFQEAHQRLACLFPAQFLDERIHLRLPRLHQAVVVVLLLVPVATPEPLEEGLGPRVAEPDPSRLAAAQAV